MTEIPRALHVEQMDNTMWVEGQDKWRKVLCGMVIQHTHQGVKDDIIGLYRHDGTQHPFQLYISHLFFTNLACTKLSDRQS